MEQLLLNKSKAMRKVMQLMLSFILAAVLTLPALAQTRNVSGVVLDNNNKPIPDATVNVKGTSHSTKTDDDGRFTISMTSGQTLVVSHVNYNKRDLKIGNENNVSFKLIPRSDDLEEVIVTAMDIKRNPKELPYDAKQVKGSEVKETGRDNFMNGLAGRVAGLTVNSTSGAAGASSQIVLRGFNSLALDNSPLYVIDGVVADNSSLNETSNQGSLLGLASDRANRGNDYSNRIADLNPNDIESVTVLKGPEATALYGSQASSGAIIITTKKAKTQKGVKVNYDNTFKFSRIIRFQDTFDGYDTGTNGVSESTFRAFGPKYAPNTQLYDNLHNFFRTGFSQNHNLSLDFGYKAASFRLSAAVLNNAGVIPNNVFKRYNFRISNSTKVSDKLTITPAISYIYSNNIKALRGASGFMLNLLVWPSDDNITEWQQENGLKKALFNSNPNNDLDNPFYNVYKNPSGDVTYKWMPSLGIDYNPLKWLSLSGRFGYEEYATDGYTRFDSMSYYTTRAQKGYQDNYYRVYKGYNHTITSTFKKDFKNFTTRLMLGTMWQDYNTAQYAVSGSNLKSFTSTDSNNTDPATRVRLSLAAKGFFNHYQTRQLAYFFSTTFGWRNAVFLTYSHRFEESSIFPKNFRQYNYPAGGLSIMLTDLMPQFKNRILGYWKLRASLANTARSSGAYMNQSVFSNHLGSGGGYYYGFYNNNPLLEPERQSTYEVGTEMRLLNNRYTIEATYYNTTNTKLIVEGFRSSYGTGFVLNTLNVGSVRNEGVELGITANLIRKTDLNWNMRFNFNKMWNKVLVLPDNVPEFYVSDTWVNNARAGLIVGGNTTTITAYSYLRNNAGQILISPTSGLPVMDNNFRLKGDRNPDFTLGWVNELAYKRFSFSMLWDLKVGGDIYNGTDKYLTTMGKSMRTADRETPRVIDGVLQDGLENTATPTKNTIAITPYYANNYYLLMPDEEFIQHDVNWLRLRDVSLNYRFGKGATNALKYVKTLGMFVTVSDPILITNYRGPDPQVNYNTTATRGVGGFGFDFGSIGMPIGVSFGIKAGF